MDKTFCFDCLYCSAEDPLHKTCDCSKTRQITYYSTPACDQFKERYQVILKNGRFNGKKAALMLTEIEKITREAFNNPDTQDINLYRAQALANILAIFEYDGATIKEEG